MSTDVSRPFEGDVVRGGRPIVGIDASVADIVNAWLDTGGAEEVEDDDNGAGAQAIDGGRVSGFEGDVTRDGRDMTQHDAGDLARRRGVVCDAVVGNPRFRRNPTKRHRLRGSMLNQRATWSSVSSSATSPRRRRCRSEVR
jgi:hypothetical protein